MLIIVMLFGTFVLYSASNQSGHMVLHQSAWFGLGLVTLIVFAQIHPRYYQQWAPHLYVIACLLLLSVLITGHIGNGARMWLSMGVYSYSTFGTHEIDSSTGFSTFV